MPANSIVIPPRGGHIDIVEGFMECPVAISVEFGRDGVPTLHLDVGRSADVEAPFSVGVEMSPAAVQRLISVLVGVQVPRAFVPPAGDVRLN